MQIQNKQKNTFFSSQRPQAKPAEHRIRTISIRYVIVFLVCVNLAALTGYVFLFGFILNKKDSIVEAVSKLDTEQLREEQLYVLRDSFRETEKEREALLRYFINEEELVAFIEDIEQAGRRANAFLRFNVVNIRETENILVMEFETIGSFNEIFYFLQLVEHVPVKISLEKFLLDKEIPRGVEKRKESDAWHAIFTLAILSFDNSSR
ncbi:MAG: hypothetical protein HYT27_02180 [Parcubacteria group bacterium]|nr:hypothetical protein [Parcubacteria group bacterium]